MLVLLISLTDMSSLWVSVVAQVLSLLAGPVIECSLSVVAFCPAQYLKVILD
jgi:hypothetical protein